MIKLLFLPIALLAMCTAGCGERTKEPEKEPQAMAERLGKLSTCVESYKTIHKVNQRPPNSETIFVMSGCNDQNPTALVIAECLSLYQRREKSAEEAEKAMERRAYELCEQEIRK
jgi:hypothetical protein